MKKRISRYICNWCVGFWDFWASFLKKLLLFTENVHLSMKHSTRWKAVYRINSILKNVFLPGSKVSNEYYSSTTRRKVQFVTQIIQNWAWVGQIWTANFMVTNSSKKISLRSDLQCPYIQLTYIHVRHGIKRLWWLEYRGFNWK